jgi:hypothetical protein
VVQEPHHPASRAVMRIVVIRLAGIRWRPYWFMGFVWGVCLVEVMDHSLLWGVILSLFTGVPTYLAHRISEGLHERQIRRYSDGTTFR